MGTTIAEMRISNFLCYRGEQELALGPGTFALVGEIGGDPARSNTAGKSAFLWAVRFALTGDHPAATEDAWITDGERVGGVDLELSDGTFVSRQRRRGEATKLEVQVPGRDPLLDKVAQEHLDRAVVGASKDEQAATWWVGQKEADSFVNGDPAPATRTIAEWCEIEPVRRAARLAADRLRDRALARDEMIRSRDEATRQADAVVARYEGSIFSLEELARKRQLDVSQLEQLVAAQKDAALLDAQLRKIDADITERGSLLRRADELEKQLGEVRVDPAELAAAKDAFESTLGRQRDAANDERTKKRLATGEFSGVCPVGGIQCPAKDELNANASANRDLLETASRRLVSADDLLRRHRTHVNELERRARVEASLSKELEGVRKRAGELATLVEIHERAAELSEGKPLDQDLPHRLQDARQALREVENDLAFVERQRALAEEAGVAAAALEPEVASLREACQVLGPSGAQRRLAEGFLWRVEAAAGRFLAGAGVDARPRFSWQRELDDLADACARCGSPFPSSRKVRTCQACGAERGRKVEQKLRCRVEPKSGGADDLAGLAVRFSAGAWLKARRGSSWSVACLDEVLAHVDQHGKRGVARQLLADLGAAFGVEQVFVSAHDPHVLDSMPRRIRVSRGELGSRLEVL